MALVVRHVVNPGVLAELQRPDISDDSPTIENVNPIGITGHRAETISDNVEEVSRWGIPQTDNMQRWRFAKTTADNHAVPVASAGMADGTVNIEPLTSSRH